MGQQYAFKHAHVIRHVCMLLFLLPFMMGCEEDKEPSVYSPTLTTNSVTGLSRFGATFQGTVMKHPGRDRKSTRLNSSHSGQSRMPSSA